MLERIFKNILDNIQTVILEHSKLSYEELKSVHDWDFIFSDFDEWVVISCYNKFGQFGSRGYWIYPLLYPVIKIDSLLAQLPTFSIEQPSAAYGHVVSGDDHWIDAYWMEYGSFEEAQIPLFFHRQYNGYSKEFENYYEMNQLITHLFDLHWSVTKSAYCTLNSLGEEIELIKIINHEIADLILIKRNILDKLLHLGKWILVRYFSYDHTLKDLIIPDSSETEIFVSEDNQLKFELISSKDMFVEYRGAQIEFPKTPRDKSLNMDNVNDGEENKYANFIVEDWKNKKILEDYSLDPVNYANYFTKSDLPLEISPIYFKAEVLDKYKNNPDKYELTERNISCRGGWHLKTYDINEYNQVHTYAIYLSRLPYKEQLHWLQFNEKPKGGISKRAFQTDFAGQFPDEKSYLQILQDNLLKLGELKIGKDEYIIWFPKGGSYKSASKGLHYVNSENPNQWHDFIIALTNITNEGFQIKTLTKIASYYGNENKELGSLGLIKFILEATDNVEKIPVTHSVLNELQKRRGKGKAHGTWETPTGSLIEDANNRLKDTINAIQELIQVFNSLDIP